MPLDANEQITLLKLRDTYFVSVPTTAASSGHAGQMAYEDGYLYICIAKDTWQRCVIATWA